MKYWPFWIAGTLALALTIHIAAVQAFPHVLMAIVHRSVEDQAGGVNTMLYPPRPNASSRGVVRPSPDLLYSVCAFDLAKGPVRISSPVPDSYWSISLYASNTDNFFTLNDRQTHGDTASVILQTEDQAQSLSQGGSPVISPTPTGLALVRALISSDVALPEVEAAVAETSCEEI
ncbi:DUF1254 domain-containing protein [Halopseudomonas salegens]|uniref:Uncharacterized membrane protein n=1 Tax=Halopseudomonas salegens TaxID=1434072 RepID=A0A1H2GV42_9GAMM|nr:DUF1254 domain-containing protein [Halopseudomonas salegens]SDU23345.1 Uncharacterized membrane protein [Halopseudomonas salegens]